MLTASRVRSLLALSLLYAAPVLAQPHQLEPCLTEAIREAETGARIKIASSWDRAAALGDFLPRSAGTPDGVFCGHAMSATGARFTMCVDQANPYMDSARKVLWSLILTARGDASLVDKSCGGKTTPAQAWHTQTKTTR